MKIEREFTNWLKECHECFDKQVCAMHVWDANTGLTAGSVHYKCLKGQYTQK